MQTMAHEPGYRRKQFWAGVFLAALFGLILFADAISAAIP